MIMFCKSCGKEIPEGQELCEECAAKEAETVVETKTVENSTSTNEIPAQEATVVNNTNNTNKNPNQDPNAKSKMAAGLLGILLGSFGVHNFYLGYTGKGVAQLLISLLSCGTLAIVSSVWGLIEGIMILTGSINTDANGNPLKD
jgi:TM2 domain-containing membrane protein YozV